MRYDVYAGFNHVKTFHCQCHICNFNSLHFDSLLYMIFMTYRIDTVVPLCIQAAGLEIMDVTHCTVIILCSLATGTGGRSHFIWPLPRIDIMCNLHSVALSNNWMHVDIMQCFLGELRYQTDIARVLEPYMS